MRYKITHSNGKIYLDEQLTLPVGGPYTFYDIPAGSLTVRIEVEHNKESETYASICLNFLNENNTKVQGENIGLYFPENPYSEDPSDF